MTTLLPAAEGHPAARCHSFNYHAMIGAANPPSNLTLTHLRTSFWASHPNPQVGRKIRRRMTRRRLRKLRSDRAKTRSLRASDVVFRSIRRSGKHCNPPNELSLGFQCRPADSQTAGVGKSRLCTTPLIRKFRLGGALGALGK